MISHTLVTTFSHQCCQSTNLSSLAPAAQTFASSSSVELPRSGIATVTGTTQDEIKQLCRQLGIDETKVNVALIVDALNNKSAVINGQSINGWSNLGRQIMLKDAIKYLSDEDKIRFLPMLGSKYDRLTMPAHQLVLDARKNIEFRYAKR